MERWRRGWRDGGTERDGVEEYEGGDIYCSSMVRDGQISHTTR